MNKIRIELPANPYNIYVGENIFKNLTKIIEKEGLSNNLFFVIDQNVWKVYTKAFDKLFSSLTGTNAYIIINPSERNKSIATVEKIYKKLMSAGLGRDTTIVAVGGGIIGDITGYAAASFMRGLKYVQVPTTLLAACDSSVGGKTGVNFGGVKNIIGAFHQPALVLIDTNFFRTLPEDELLCGLGEVIKNAYLTNTKFSKYISKNILKVFGLNGSVIKNLVKESVVFKGGVVVADEKEQGLRKILNLGHTFGHALETEQKYRIKHGQAVIVGLVCSFYLSHKLKIIDNARLNEFLKLPLLFKDKIKLTRVDLKKVYKVMMSDKKNRNGKIKFVLTKDIGNILVDVEASQSDVINSARQALSLFK